MPESKQNGPELLPREQGPLPEQGDVAHEQSESASSVDVGRVERPRRERRAKPSSTHADARTEVVAPEKDTVLMHVEEILADGLGNIYNSLANQDKAKFKKKGEETASAIASLARRGQVKAHRILRFIREWLLLIPAVNKFFLEQEVKIKTDRVLLLAEDLRKTV